MKPIALALEFTHRLGFETNTETVIQQGKGLVKVNGQPLSLVQPEILRFKVCATTAPSKRERSRKGGTTI